MVAFWSRGPNGFTPLNTLFARPSQKLRKKEHRIDRCRRVAWLDTPHVDPADVEEVWLVGARVVSLRVGIDRYELREKTPWEESHRRCRRGSWSLRRWDPGACGRGNRSLRV